jgi:hypothetical protein
MVEKLLGKITKAEFGWGGYNDAMLGLTLSFASNSSGVSFHRGDWGVECTEHCRWTEAERLNGLGKAIMYLGTILTNAKKQSVHQLVGTPVELTLEGNLLKDWRVLTEVL